MSRRRQRRQRTNAPPSIREWAETLAKAGHKRFARNALKRECGSCSVCCTIKSIRTLDKPSFSPCPQLECNGRCRIYPRRPDECAGYYCTWRAGFGPDTARPDRLGGEVLVDLEPKPHLAQALRCAPDDARVLVGTIRASGPFRAEPIAQIVRDLAKVGVLYFGCVDLLTPDGKPYMLTSIPRAIFRMVGLFARMGVAPWNRDPEMIDPSALRTVAESGSDGLWSPKTGSPALREHG